MENVYAELEYSTGLQSVIKYSVLGHYTFLVVK